MKIRTHVFVPFAKYDLSVRSSQPRLATAFEYTMVKMVSDFSRHPELAEASLRQLFAEVLGVANADAFLETAAGELFSASLDVLRSRDVRWLDVPVGEIELTENGRRLLENALLPADSVETKKTKWYDLLSRKVIAPVKRAKSHEGGMGVVDGEAYEGIDPLPTFQAEFEEALAKKEHGGRIEDVELKSRVVYHRQEDVDIVMDASGSIDLETDNKILKEYLRGLPVERFRSIVLHGFTSLTAPIGHMEDLNGVTVELEDRPSVIEDADPIPCCVACRRELSEAGVLTVERYSPKTLDVLYSTDVAEPVFTPSRNGQVAELKIPREGAVAELPENADCNLDKISGVVLRSLVYNGQVLELPIGIEASLPRERSEALRRCIVQALLVEPTQERFLCALVVSGNEEARRMMIREWRERGGHEDELEEIAAWLDRSVLGDAERKRLMDLFRPEGPKTIVFDASALLANPDILAWNWGEARVVVPSAAIDWMNSKACPARLKDKVKSVLHNLKVFGKRVARRNGDAADLPGNYNACQKWVDDVLAVCCGYGIGSVVLVLDPSRRAPLVRGAEALGVTWRDIAVPERILQ